MRAFNEFESEVRSYCRAFPVVFSRAKGACLFDEQNRRYIDFLSGAGSLNYGHNNPRLKRALADYLENDGIIQSLDLATHAKREFIEQFRSVILQPRGLDYKLQFTGPTGTNGIEAVLKLAKKVTGRSNIIAFTGAYHGLTAGALSITADRSFRHDSFVSRSSASFLPFDGYFEGLDSIGYMRRILADSSSGVDLPAAVIVETVQAEAGVNIASLEWLKSLESICREYGLLLIVDDIQVGNGRTGPFFSFERAGIYPDIVVLSKSISGFGLPMTLVLIRPQLDVWSPGEHTGTFRGNNLAFVAGAEALSYWRDDQLSQRIVRLGTCVSHSLEKITSLNAQMKLRCRGVGLIWGVEVNSSEVAAAIRNNAFENGLIIELCGAEHNVLKILPPLTIEESELEEGLAILHDAITKGDFVSLANHETQRR